MEKDSLTQLFQARFQGHESPVDPGLWQAIQSQVDTLPSAEGDDLSELFRERFQGHESAVDPSAWANIGAQLGHGATVGTTAGSGLLGGYGWVAAVVGTLAIAGSVYLLSDGPTATVATVAPTNTEVQQPQVSDPLPSPTAQPLVANAIAAPDATRPTAGTAAPPAAAPASPAQRTLPNAQSGSEQGTLGSNPSPPDPDATPVTGHENGPLIVENIINQLTAKAEEDVRAQMPERPVTPPPPLDEDGSVGTEDDTDAPLAELPKLFLPDIFTPNGDGVNDTYEVKGEGFVSVLVRVFSVQRDQLVFSTNTAEPWSGENCPDGMYLVAVEAVTEDGRSVTEGKVLWLNRSPQH